MRRRLGRLWCRSRRGARAARRPPAAHAALLRTVPEASVTVNAPPKQVALTYSEAVEPRFAIVSVTDAAGRQETTGPPRRSPANPDTLLVPLEQLARGLVPRLLACHLGRRPPGARRVHVRGRAECRAGAAVPGSVDLRVGSDTAAARRTLGRLPLGDGRDRACSRCGSRSHAPSSGASAGTSLRASRSRSPSPRSSGSSRFPSTLLLATADFAFGRSSRSASLVPLVPRLGVRPRLPRPLALLRALRRGSGGGALGRPARSRAALDRRAARDLRRRARCGSDSRHARRSPAMPRKPRRAGSRSSSTGCTSPPVSCGSAVSSGCSFSGAAFLRPRASPGSSSPCRASRTSRSSPCSS